jgi:hypothetical protein
MLSGSTAARRFGAVVAGILMVACFPASLRAAHSPVRATTGAFKLGAYEGKTSPVLFLQGNKLVSLRSLVAFTLRTAPLSACGGPKASKATVVCLSGRAVGATWATRAVGGGSECTPSTSSGTLAPVQTLGWSPVVRMPASSVLVVNQAIPNAEIIKAHLTASAAGLTGSLDQIVYIQGPATGNKEAAVCSTGAVRFTAQWQGP